MSLPEARIWSVHCRYTADSVRFVSKKGGSYLPLEVLIKLLAETVDAGPIQLLVQGVCGSVCSRREGQCGLVRGPSLSYALPWQQSLVSFPAEGPTFLEIMIRYCTLTPYCSHPFICTPVCPPDHSASNSAPENCVPTILMAFTLRDNPD